jgi:hypothetical protein
MLVKQKSQTHTHKQTVSDTKTENRLHTKGGNKTQQQHTQI